MANVVKDLGAVSAYALAVKYGYEGTEAEWVAAQEAARIAAEAAAEEAKASEGAAKVSEDAAKGSETAASASASVANAAAEQASNSKQEAVANADAAKASQEAAAQSASEADASREAAARSAQEAAESSATAQSVKDSIPVDYTQLVALVDRKAPAIECGVSGGMNTVADASDQPAFSLVSTITAVQYGEGEPAPDNVRSIGGWDAVNLNRTAKNLFLHNTDEIKEMTYISSNGTERILKGYEIDLPAGDYKVNAEYVDADAGIIYVYGIIIDKDRKAKQTGVNPVTGATVKEMEFTLDDGDKLILYNGSTSHSLNQTKSNFKRVSFAIYTADVATNMDTYDGTTLTTNFPETVYGGCLNWNTGILEITHGHVVLDGETNLATSKSTQAAVNCYVVPATTWGRKYGEDVVLTCTHFAFNGVSATSQGVEKDGIMIGINSIGSLYVGYDAIATLEDFNAYLQAQYAAGTPVTVVYELLEPRTVQLTQQQLELLKGYNAVWSDTGDTAMTYIADTKMYIDNAINAIAASIINA